MKDQKLRDKFHAYRPPIDDNEAFMDRLMVQMDAEDEKQQSEHIIPLHRNSSTILTTLRVISSVAAIYLVGLFFYLQTGVPATAQYNNKVEKKQPAPQPRYCTEGTPQEILMCYLERKREQPTTYSFIKQKIYESQH